nr:MAG: hypothetical protein 1 [Leviviridae sp.]
MVAKKRTYRVQLGRGTWYFYNDPPEELVPMTAVIAEECITFNHSKFRDSLGKGDVGGPFWSSKTKFEVADNFQIVQGLGRRYEGTLHTGYHTRLDAAAPKKPASFLDLAGLGATAIARTIPTNPISGAAVFLGEAREGVPRLIGHELYKSRAKDLRKVGGEYLNVEFGWAPIVNDLKKFAKAVKSSNKTIRQLHRDSGKTVRRRYHFPMEVSKTNPNGPSSPANTPLRCDGGRLDAWMIGPYSSEQGWYAWAENTVKTWFSGAYSYVVPSRPTGFWDSLDYYDAEANKLLGSRITPEVLWNLAPWSWAADWFTNVGDVMHNYSMFGQDSLCLKHGYVMRHTTSLTHVEWRGRINLPPDGTQSRFISVREAYGTETKLRLQASPFGFGSSGLVGLTNQQTAIALALGLSKAPRDAL